MPANVINPHDGDDLLASTITTNVTDRIVAWESSHETGATTNGAVRHTGDQIDDAALPELATPSSAAQGAGLGVHARLDMFAVVLSGMMGASGSGYAAKYTALGGLTYGSLAAVNTALTTGASAAAGASTLVRRASDGSANYSGTLGVVAISGTGNWATTGSVTAVDGIYSGVIRAGSGAHPITTAAGNLDATQLTNTLPAGSFPAMTGDVTSAGASLATVVSAVGGKTAAQVASVTTSVLAASSSGVGNHGAVAKYDVAGGMTFDGPVAAPSFVGTLTGSASSASTAGTAAALTVLNPVAMGGTGVAALPANGVVIGNGTSPVASVAPGMAGTVLASDGTTWGAGVVTVPDYSLTTRKLSDGAVVPYLPGTLHVHVNAMKKFDGAGNPVEWSGGDLDLSSYVPGSGTSVWVMVYLNATAAVYAAAGQASATPLKPQAIGGQTPLAYLLMYAGMTQIAAADIYEWRTDFAAFAVGGGTGSGYSAVGHLHGQGGESFVAVTATDEGRVTTPNVAGMTVYVQPMRYSDTNAVVQQFPGGPSATIARPVSNPYLVAVGLSQASSVTLNYGAEAANPVRGPFLNATDIPLSYILVRPGSTRTILNDDNTNALIIDARRPYTFSSPAASGVSGVSTGGTGQSSFATAGIVISPGGTAPLVTIPGAASATVGMAVTPTVAPAGLDADGFQIGPVTIATTGTNITNYRSMHLMSPTKTGAGTVANMFGVSIDGPTIAGTSSTVANYVKTGTTGSVGMVVDTVAAPSGNIQEWRANGAAVATLSPLGTFAPTGMRGVTAFPAAPVGGLTVYREDLGAWYRAATGGGTVTTAITGSGSQTVTTVAAHNLAVGDLVTVGSNNVAVTAVPSTTTFTASFGSAVAGSTAYTAVGWRQVGNAFWATAALAPAAPPTDYRYTNLTDRATYRWNGSAYQKQGTSVEQLNWTQAADLFNATAATTGAWTQFLADQSFTLDDANSLVTINLNLEAVVGNTAQGTFTLRAMIDGSTSFAYKIGGGYSNGTSNFSRIYGQSIALPPGTLTAGAHTIRLQYFVSVGMSIYCLPTSNPTDYGLVLQVVEAKP